MNDCSELLEALKELYNELDPEDYHVTRPKIRRMLVQHGVHFNRENGDAI